MAPLGRRHRACAGHRGAAGGGRARLLGPARRLQPARRRRSASSSRWHASCRRWPRTLNVFSERGTHRLQAGPYASRDLARDTAEQVRNGLQLAPVIVERR